MAVIAITNGEDYKLLKHCGNYYMFPLPHPDTGLVHDGITGKKKVS